MGWSWAGCCNWRDFPPVRNGRAPTGLKRLAPGRFQVRAFDGCNINMGGIALTTFRGRVAGQFLPHGRTSATRMEPGGICIRRTGTAIAIGFGGCAFTHGIVPIPTVRLGTRRGPGRRIFTVRSGITSTTGFAWGAIVALLATTPRAGRNQTFTFTRRWIPRTATCLTTGAKCRGGFRPGTATGPTSWIGRAMRPVMATVITAIPMGLRGCMRRAGRGRSF